MNAAPRRHAARAAPRRHAARAALRRRIARAALRKNLSCFIHRTFMTVSPGQRYLANWHIDALAWHLKQVAEGKCKRLIVTLPPRHLKSIAVSVAFPAWLLGHNPRQRIVCVSYSQDLADKHALDTRAVLNAAWYRRCHPRTRLSPEKHALGELMTTRRGSRLATSVGGTLTGRGGNILLIDDPHKADEAQAAPTRQAVIDWYRNTLLSRLDDPNGAIVLVQQRLHQEDLAGHLLQQGGWTHLNLPAIAEEAQRVPLEGGRFHTRSPGDVLHPARHSRAFLEQAQRDMGSYAFAAQYQQQPAPQGGGLIQWRWFPRYRVAPAKAAGGEIVQSWDTALKAGTGNDWSVCTTWLHQDHRSWLLDVVRERLEFPDLKRRVAHEAARHRAGRILIEDHGAGTALIQDLHRETSLPVVGVAPARDKPTRLLTVSPAIESGRVLLPEDAPWLADLHHELVLFPNARHDDQVDSLSQYLTWERERAAMLGSILLGPPLASLGGDAGAWWEDGP
jgi:predicted phage terminase large subunit-like protein